MGDSISNAQHGGTALEAVEGALARFTGATQADRVALIHDGQQYTYTDLAAAVAIAVRVLRSRGVARGQHVALLMENCPEYVVWYLAALRGGNPITPLHPKSSSTDLAFIIVDADIALLIHSRGMEQLAKEVAAAAGDLATAVAGSCWQDTAPDAGLPSVADVVPLEPDDIAKITYTGGTTGRPKGVVQTHEMVRQCVLMELAEWPWPRPPRFIATTPLSHGAGFLVIPTLVLGGAIITTSRSGATNLAAEIRATGATVTFVVPSMIHSFLTRLADPERELASLELIVYGGSPIASADLTRSIELFPGRLVQLYGQTESPMILATLRPEDHDARRPSRAASCGLPSIGVTVTIRDDEDQEVPVGAVGEICARGPLVMPRYWKRPGETEVTLRNGWLHTGDLGAKDQDGYITVVGRKKDMIITGGFNVYPKEVEDALLTHPDILDAAAFGVPDSVWGEKLVAVVVLAENCTVPVDELARFVRELKGTVQTPKQIQIIDAVPLTAVGKPDKAGLRATFPADGAGPAPDGGNPR